LLTPIASRPTARVFTPFPLRFEQEQGSEKQSSGQPKNHAGFRNWLRRGAQALRILPIDQAGRRTPPSARAQISASRKSERSRVADTMGPSGAVRADREIEDEPPASGVCRASNAFRSPVPRTARVEHFLGRQRPTEGEDFLSGRTTGYGMS
jgi:hypothetical protein